MQPSRGTEERQRRAVLFDIDGTLVRAGGAGREALARGAAAVSGLPLARVRELAEGIDFRGRVDHVLVREYAARVGLDPATAYDTLLQAYLAALPATLQAAPFEVMPGVLALVEQLERRGDVLVGLLTGNVREGARLKLQRAGLERLTARPGGFGDDGADRVEVARSAVRRAREAGVAGAREVVVVGDTQHDVTAAHAAGARAVGVLTGWTPREDLAAAGPELLLDDLGDPAPLLALLD